MGMGVVFNYDETLDMIGRFIMEALIKLQLIYLMGK